MGFSGGLGIGCISAAAVPTERARLANTASPIIFAFILDTSLVRPSPNGVTVRQVTSRFKRALRALHWPADGQAAGQA